MDFDAMLAVKVTVLERLIKDLWVTQFLTTDDPVAAARAYASRRREPGQNAIPASDAEEAARQSVWDQVLDDIVGGVARLAPPRR